MSFKLVFFLFTHSAAATVNLVTTTTDLAWAARAIGGDQVKVVSLLKGTEDPHYVDALPSFIRKVANADILCSVGLDLETAWLSKVLNKSANARVQKGGSGFCQVSSGFTPLDVRTDPVDRSMGDVHSKGNPHFQLSPTYFAQAAAVIADILIKNAPKHAALFRKGYAKFKSRLQKIETETRALIRTKRPVVEYHREFTYFFHAYRLKSIGSVEKLPGVPPSAGRLARIALLAKKEKVGFAFVASHNPQKLMHRFSELSGVPLIKAPISLQSSGPFASYAALQKHLARALTK